MKIAFSGRLNFSKSLCLPRFIVLMAILLCTPFLTATADNSGSPSVSSNIEIVASAKRKAGVSLTFVALLFDRRVRNSSDGYSPSTSLPMRWTEAPTLRWDFGDGTPQVTSNDSLSAAHTYRQKGSYNLKVTVEDSEGIYATGELVVTVSNNEPKVLRLAGVNGETAGSVVFTASVQDTPDDQLTYEWDLGDGTRRQGVDLWQVDHQYVNSGNYTVTLKVVDEDGAEEVNDTRISVSDGNNISDVSWQARDEDSDIETVLHGMNADISGGLSTNMSAELYSLGGALLSKTKSGQCRFAFTAWDNSKLMYATMFLDFPVIPPYGAKYQFSKPQVGLVLTANQSVYQILKRSRAGLGGIGGRGAQATPVAGQSPFGIDSNAGYLTSSGTADIEFVPREYVKGTYDLVLVSSEKGRSPISFKANFAFDLNAHTDIAVYEGCNEAPPLKIVQQYPEADSKHVILPRPPVRVKFDQKIDPNTVTNANAQLGYPDASGQFTPVAVRILRADDTFWLVPESPLKPGVRHKVRVKGGEFGVKAVNGASLDELDEDEWSTWEFTSKLDFDTDINASQLLSCHVYQTVRDVPLIAGKPAVVRVDASWPKLADVDASAQLTQFEARAIVVNAQGNEVAGKWHQFIRPDLWSKNGIDLKSAEQSALITLPKVDNATSRLYTKLQVRTNPMGKESDMYYVRCPATVWDKKPTLTVDLFALRIDDWLGDDAFQAVLPVIGQLSKEIEDYSWQLFPFADVKVGSSIGSTRPLNLQGLNTWIDSLTGKLNRNEASEEYIYQVVEGLTERSSADVIILLVPHGSVEGGRTLQTLNEGQGVIFSLVSGTPEYFSRYVNAAVHEIGHALTLDHLPYVNSGEERELIINTVLKSGGTPWFGGIEGMRMSRDGNRLWNKSSVDGNQEDAAIIPLMFPRTNETKQAFIAHHQYRLIQKFLETKP